MLNINNKSWNKVRPSDIRKLLSEDDDENFFLEFKSDEESPKKLAKEVSALSNTYGGYILLGINDDKTVGGCEKWTEERVHTTIYESITPTPIFDIRQFKVDGGIVIVIRIEEGKIPPYITNEGKIYERLSSGSYPIKDSIKLGQLFHRKTDQIIKIKNKIELDDIMIDKNFPDNLCGYLDLGFSLDCSENVNLQNNFYRTDLVPIAKKLRKDFKDFSISRVGRSYVFSIGSISINNSECSVLPPAGMHNFIEVMCDGSVRCRVMLSAGAGDNKVDISYLLYTLFAFRDVYHMLIDGNLAEIFICAHKYERLKVIKQFVPYYKIGDGDREEDKNVFSGYWEAHCDRYGNNLIIESSRVPKNDYLIIDRRSLEEKKIEYNTTNIVEKLFLSGFLNLGYIDDPEQQRSE